MKMKKMKKMAKTNRRKRLRASLIYFSVNQKEHCFLYRCSADKNGTLKSWFYSADQYKKISLADYKFLRWSNNRLVAIVPIAQSDIVKDEIKALIETGALKVYEEVQKENASTKMKATEVVKKDADEERGVENE